MSLIELAEFVDEVAASPVLVLGSWPPAGRDLDLLTRRDDEALEAGISAQGFELFGSLWLRFRRCSVDVIDLRSPSDLSLPKSEFDALFEEARPIAGMSQLRRPAPHHELLILARRAGERHAPLTDRRRARVDSALEEDAGAWEEAGRRADAWRGARALANLRAAYSGEEVPRWSALRARSERRGSGTPGTLREGARLVGARVTSMRGTLITFSGIDGSGKTSQIEHLRETLDRLGFDTVRVWNRLAVNPSLDFIGVPVKRLLRLFRRAAPSTASTDPKTADSARQWRNESDLLTFGWTLVVALWNALSQRRATQPHLMRGRVVLCDRYTLDSTVNLHYLYGERRNYKWQQRLIRAISPRPALSVFIDVDAKTAHERKPVKYEVQHLERYVHLYRRMQASSDVVRVNGEPPEEEVCSDIARLVWHRLYRG